jgi:hypothetical protein
MTLDLDDLLPDIFEHLENANNKKSVTLHGLEDFAYEVQIRTGLTYEISSIIVKMFFQELRSSMLRGDMITIRNFGKLFISSPKFSKNKKRVFPVFKPYKSLINK